MARANPPMSGAFLAELTRHLQGQSPHFAFANSWLEHRLSEHGLTTERLVLAEGQAQAADQVSMGNSITSLRFLGANDWRAFVEQHSQVEQGLARGSGWRLCPDGLRHARPLPPRRGGNGQAKPSIGIRRRPRRDRARPGRGGRETGRSNGTRRLLPDRSGPRRAGARPAVERYSAHDWPAGSAAAFRFFSTCAVYSL